MRHETRDARRGRRGADLVLLDALPDLRHALLGHFAQRKPLVFRACALLLPHSNRQHRISPEGRGFGVQTHRVTGLEFRV
eukprot:1955881-Rhodomonas_salina.1